MLVGVCVCLLYAHLCDASVLKNAYKGEKYYVKNMIFILRHSKVGLVTLSFVKLHLLIFSLTVFCDLISDINRSLQIRFWKTKQHSFLANIKTYKNLSEVVRVCFLTFFSCIEKLLQKMNCGWQTNKTLVAQLSQRISRDAGYSWSSSGNSRSTQGHLQQIVSVKGPSPSTILFPLISLFSPILVPAFLPPSHSALEHWDAFPHKSGEGRRRPLGVSYSSFLFPWRSSIVQFAEWMKWACFGYFPRLGYFKSISWRGL